MGGGAGGMGGGAQGADFSQFQSFNFSSFNPHDTFRAFFGDEDPFKGTYLRLLCFYCFTT